MNLKKMLLIVTTMILFTVFVFAQTSTYAHGSATQWMGTQELMNDQFGYSINDPSSAGVNIWNIVVYPGGGSNYNNNHNIYCLKEGQGFTTSTGGNKQQYDYWYNMKTDKDAIKQSSYDNTVKNFIGKNIGSDPQVDQYNAVLAVLDRLYIPNQSTLEDKKKLICDILKFAKTNNIHNADIEKMSRVFDINGFEQEEPDEEEYKLYDFIIELTTKEQAYLKYDLTDYALTDEEIVAVQQAALWYFTNYGETRTGKNNFSYDLTNKTNWFWYKQNSSKYDSMSNYNPKKETPNSGTIGEVKSYQAEVLYNYIIKTAKENASKYENLTTTAPVKVENKKLTSTEDQGNYKIGPITITSQTSSMPYTIDFGVNNGSDHLSNYKIVDENGTESDLNTLIAENKKVYISIPKTAVNNNVDSIKIDIKVTYYDTTMKLWVQTTQTNEQPLVEINREKSTKTITLTMEEPEKEFDLALRKYITKINDTELTGDKVRVPNIDEINLEMGTTAKYKHKKDPVTVNTGDKVTYKLTIYNEGEVDGRATEIIDQLPEGLEFSKVVNGNFDLGNYDKTTNKLTLVRKSDNKTNLPAYEKGNLVDNGKGSETIEIECTVTATPDKANSKILTNIAWIAKVVEGDSETETTEGTDRDSKPSEYPSSYNKDNMSDYIGNGNKSDLTDSTYYYKGQQDDDDFEKLVLLPEVFDLALRKFITSVNDQTVPERVTLRDQDVSNLNKVDENGNIIDTTADYQESKEPVAVKKGDIVTYTLRIYNEGTIDGYAQEITEDIPEGLEFLWSEKEGEELQKDPDLTAEEKEAIEFNQNYLWGKFKYDDKNEKIIQISTDYLSQDKETTVGGNLIQAFGRNDGTKTAADLKYKEVAVKFKVVSDDTSGNVIRNEAAITDDSDKDKQPVDDRDSTPEDWHKHPDHEDDEDHDYIVLQSFDLSLRKFIVAISDDTKIENTEYLKNQDGSYTRAPVVDTSKLNTVGEDGKLITTATYNHTKEPLLVKPNDVIVYMLRVYNEGGMNGYASEIKDHLPPYLEFVKGEFNEQYGWEISEDGRTATTRYLENSLIDSAKTDESGKIVLSYKEVPIMCKVKSEAKTSEKITNIADITEYLNESKKSVIDRDSQEDNVKLPEDKDLPSYKDNETGSYIPGQQDDDDFEKVIVKVFDLALRKWVTQAIVIENGQQTVTQTGHDPWDDPEAVVKVELHRKKINQVTVKFKYSIRVYNQGEVAGYAKEVTDYIPEGLKFVAQDNPGWTDEGNNVISTRLLENTLLQPGEYADVEVLLTWINNENNMGVMNNIAEISEDDNEYDLPDIDSTPDNKKSGEDDIDDAPVMLSVSTGQVRIYFTLGFVILITIASGIVLIKKFVL